MPKAHLDTPKGAQQILLDHPEAFFRRIGLESDKMEAKVVSKLSQNRAKNVLEIENVFWMVLDWEIYRFH